MSLGKEFKKAFIKASGIGSMKMPLRIPSADGNLPNPERKACVYSPAELAKDHVASAPSKSSRLDGIHPDLKQHLEGLKSKHGISGTGSVDKWTKLFTHTASRAEKVKSGGGSKEDHLSAAIHHTAADSMISSGHHARMKDFHLKMANKFKD